MLNSNVDILVLVRIWGLFLTVPSCALTNIFFWISFHSIEKICRSQKVISFTSNLISSTIGSNYLHSSILLCLLAYVHFSFRFRQCRTVFLQDKQLCVVCFHFLSLIPCIFSIFFEVSTMLNSNVDILVLVRIWSPLQSVSSCASTNIYFRAVSSFTWNLISSTIGSNYLHSSIHRLPTMAPHTAYCFECCSTYCFDGCSICCLVVWMYLLPAGFNVAPPTGVKVAPHSVYWFEGCSIFWIEVWNLIP